VEAAAMAEEVFRNDPQHPGAAHYLIHAYDDPQLAPLGLRAAEAYAKIAPASEHAIHMPSHIFLQLGMWNKLVASNEKAFSASVAWARRKGHPASNYDFHSLYWLHYGYLQQGRYREASALEDSARLMLAEERDDMKMWARMGPALMHVQYVAEGGQSNGISPETDRDRVTALYGLGLAAAQTGDTGQLRAAEQETKSYMDSVKVVSKPVRVSDLVLQAQLAKLGGRPDEAASLLERAATIEDSIRAVGPPYGLPSREVLAQLLLARGQAKQAADQFDLALQRTPNRSEALLGRARAAVSLGDSASARLYYAMLLTNWKTADADLPGLAEAKVALARLSSACAGHKKQCP
jgi:tetratricopeptide (TPR) repeat protein